MANWFQKCVGTKMRGGKTMKAAAKACKRGKTPRRRR
jgi:hypothetical protein